MADSILVHLGQTINVNLAFSLIMDNRPKQNHILMFVYENYITDNN